MTSAGTSNSREDRQATPTRISLISCALESESIKNLVSKWGNSRVSMRGCGVKLRRIGWHLTLIKLGELIKPIAQAHRVVASLKSEVAEGLGRQRPISIVQIEEVPPAILVANHYVGQHPPGERAQ